MLNQTTDDFYKKRREKLPAFDRWNSSTVVSTFLNTLGAEMDFASNHDGLFLHELILLDDHNLVFHWHSH